MNKKLIAIFSVILIFLCCLSVVSADNESDTDDTATIEETTVETEPAEDGGTDDKTEIDLSNYITALSLGSGAIQFSDGFTGYKMDPSKEDVSDDDGFTAEGTASAGGNENYFKLAVIEAYKAGRENDLDSIISSFADGSYQSSSDPVIQAVLASDETIGDNAVVKIDDTTEATFDFEVLTPVDGETSSYFAYSVSLATVENDKLSASPDDAENDTLTAPADDENDTLTEPDDAENDTLTAPAEDENDTLSEPDENKDTSGDDANATPATPQEEKQTGDSQTAVNQTDKTVVNKENTTIINEKNTTVINKNNVQPAKQPPKEPPVHQRILKAAGNPITILIIVIVLGGAAAIVLRRRKD